MADVDYMRYAQLVNQAGDRSIGLNDLGETLSGIDKSRMMREDQTRRNTLADLQIQQGQMQLSKQAEENDYRQGLKSAMSNPLSVTSITPQTPQVPGVLPEALSPQGEFQLPQTTSPEVQAYNEGRVSTKTESPVSAGIKFATSQGRYDDVKALMSVDDAMNMYAAKVLESKGDPAEYYAAKLKLDGAKEFAGAIKDFAKTPELLKKMWPVLAKAYPDAAGISPDMIGTSKDGIVIPLTVNGEVIPNRFIHYDENGKGQIIDATPKKGEETWGKPYLKKVGGKLIEQQESSTGQVRTTAQDTSTTVKVTSGNGQEPVAQSTFVDAETGKPLVFDKKTGSYRVANVEGGVAPKPGAMSPEQATRAQQFETVITNIPKIREMVLDKNGKIISRLDIANSQVGTWGTKGREIKQAVKRTIEQALRIATGAAAPDSEVASYTDMYAPQVGDTDAMITAKFDALQKFAEGTRAKYNVGRSEQAINLSQGGTPQKGKTSTTSGKPQTSGALKKSGKGFVYVP